MDISYFENILVFLCLCVSAVFSIIVHSHGYHRHVRFENIYCSSGVDTAGLQRSPIACAIYCNSITACMGIFYNNLTKICSTVKTVPTPEVGCGQQNGSNLYVRMSYEVFVEYNFTYVDIERLSTETAEQICNSYNYHTLNADIDASRTACGTSPCCKTKGCHSGSLSLYHGTWSTTAYGRTCQRWDQQWPHQHNRDADGGTWFGETPSEAHNYCRDPDFEGFLWCYTMDPNKRFESCGIPVCP